MYATGSGFIPNSSVDVYIWYDIAWTDNMTIPGDVSSDGPNYDLPIDGAGILGSANVWAPPLTPGDYDMVFDADQDGKYNASADAVDGPNPPGFRVNGAVGGTVEPVDKISILAPWLALAAFIVVAMAVILLFKRRRVA